MTTSRANLSAVIGMLQRAERFDAMPAAQQAALRAQVTRTIRVTVDPDILIVLEQIQDVIGAAAPRQTERQTAADLVAEYEASYASYTGRQKAAFKARVSRMGNTAGEDGDAETAAAMSELTERIVHDEEAGQRDLIRRLSSQLRKA